MDRIVLAGNWKMNKSLKEAIEFIEILKNKNINNGTEIHIYAPSLYLTVLQKMVQGTNIVIGAQNAHQEDSGAYTGEVSLDMLKSINIENVLVGHSERRQYFNETDEVVNKKTKLALSKGITPIVCVGETLDEKELNITEKILREQIAKGLDGISSDDMKNVIVAYEPVWAIGTGKTSTATDANDSCKIIREEVAKMFDGDIAYNLVIQYGGSVKPENVKEILEQSDINGALIGGASLDVDSFINIIK